jgi:putative acetyltransferase
VALAIQLDDPRSPDVVSLINNHLEFARAQTPLCHVFALPAEAMLDDDLELYSCRDGEELLAIGALRIVSDGHLEIKSMHTAQLARRRGVGRSMLNHLITVARSRGARRVSLETGNSSGFAAARSLYENSGFKVCEPFGDYSSSDDNVCMTLVLKRRQPSRFA